MSRKNTYSPWTRAAAKRTKIRIRIANLEIQITEFQLVKTNTKKLLSPNVQDKRKRFVAAVLRVMVQ